MKMCCKNHHKLLKIRVPTYYTVLCFQGIISKRIDLGDFILHGNWTITAVYGHQVFHFPCFIPFNMRLKDINISKNETRFKIGIYIRFHGRD